MKSEKLRGKKLGAAAAAGFTLVELLVVIAVITILMGAIIVGINPAKRINAAKDARAKSDVKQVAQAVEACLAYVDPSTEAVNNPDDCDTAAELTSGGFARVVPSVTINSDSTGDTDDGTVVCISEQGATGSHWKYITTAGVIVEGTAACTGGA